MTSHMEEGGGGLQKRHNASHLGKNSIKKRHMICDQSLITLGVVSHIDILFVQDSKSQNLNQVQKPDPWN